jgi:hypothetical protein
MVDFLPEFRPHGALGIVENEPANPGDSNRRQPELAVRPPELLRPLRRMSNEIANQWVKA